MDAKDQKYELTLMLPYALLRVSNPMSGYIQPGSQFANKSVYGLFMSQENIHYLTSIIQKELENDAMPVDLGMSVKRMMFNYKKIKTGEVERESVIQNPLIELAYRNREFVQETLENIRIRNTPHEARHHHQNFLMSYQNITDQQFNEVDWGTMFAHLGDAGRNVYRNGNRINPDRISAQQRHYERDITETLRDTRQLETPISGYDMSGLRSNSSNRTFDNNEYTPY